MSITWITLLSRFQMVVWWCARCLLDIKILCLDFLHCLWYAYIYITFGHESSSNISSGRVFLMKPEEFLHETHKLLCKNRSTGMPALVHSWRQRLYVYFLWIGLPKQRKTHTDFKVFLLLLLQTSFF